jgi:hypothetical protein
LEVFMKNNLLNRATAALNNAGFQVIGFKQKGCKPLKLKVIQDGPEPGESGYKGIPAPQRSAGFSIVKRSIGETCDLVRFLGAGGWRHAFNLVQEVIRAGKISALNPGDFINVSFDAPAASHKGVGFEALHIGGKVIITAIEEGKVVFNFDDIIFRSPINEENTNKGGFHASALAEYLNTGFLNAVGIGDVLLACNGEWQKNGHKITLPTAYEVFGDEEYAEAPSNFFEKPRQIDFYKRVKNRIKAFEDDTHWYWLASARASSAANFCGVSHNGGSSYSVASAGCGVAPAFCVA